MKDKDEVDYGPLAALVGSWEGGQGVDIAPESDGIENNPYYETIIFEAIGGVTNAESQLLAALHYRQRVSRKSNDKVFHDQTGYWMWDAESKVIMHSFSIPRGVTVLAGGQYQENTDGPISLSVSASDSENYWLIVQSPFMMQKAKTVRFTQTLQLEENQLQYRQSTVLDIYGQTFDHTDVNILQRMSS